MKKLSLKSCLDLDASKVPFGADPDVVAVGSNLFDSEEIIDTAYKAFCDLLVEGWNADPRVGFDIEAVASTYMNGLYACAVERAVITHQYDHINDSVPAQFSMWEDSLVTSFREVSKIPRGFASAAHGRHFSMTTISSWKKGEGSRASRHVVTLKPNGEIYPARRVDDGTIHDVLGYRMISLLASVSINLYCDRRYLWQVVTQEETYAPNPTPLCIGVSPDHIKSLFYARTLPVTESGRKRPILHWVRAHQRRMRDGIDIDITKHLRGVESFEMGGFRWDIINPVKEAA